MSNTEITYFAKTNFRNQERVFGIKRDDRRRHIYVIGKTGMGKSVLLENLIIQDIRNGHGVAVIDPNGDLAEKVVNMIPANRLKDVIYFNPADLEFPIAFNVMESVASDQRHLVASGLVGVFKKMWAESWGPRLEYILRNAILALLETPNTTLLGIMRILIDKTYRKQVLVNVKDPVVHSFWEDEFVKWDAKSLQEVVSPIQNKVGQFLSSYLLRNIVGQQKSSFDMRGVMDEGKILICNLSKGLVGEDNSKLLGAMLITKIQLAAMSRADVPEEQRKDFCLYVDEFQNFATESFATILAEARKYRLSLTLAHQYILQIDETVRNAIFGNVGTLISFRVGASDAEYLEKEFAPIFTANDIVNLTRANIYLKLMIDGISGDAFSATTLPPTIPIGTEVPVQAVVEHTHTTYSLPRKDVERRIALYLGAVPQDMLENIASPLATTVSQASAVVDEGVVKPVIAPTFLRSGSVVDMAVVRSSEVEGVVKENTTQQQCTEGSTEEKTAEQESSIKSIIGDDGRTMYAALCSRCGNGVLVPFIPDGRRPTFCRNCFKENQKAQAQKILTQTSSPSIQQYRQHRPYEQINDRDAQRQFHRDGHAPRVSHNNEQKNEVQYRRPIQSSRRGNFNDSFDASRLGRSQQPLLVRKTTESGIYVPQEQPMSLSQLSTMQPRGFQRLSNFDQKILEKNDSGKNANIPSDSVEKDVTTDTNATQ